MSDLIAGLERKLNDFIADDILPSYDIPSDIWRNDPEANEAVRAFLTSALAASEEARRAERAAVVRECAETTEEDRAKIYDRAYGLMHQHMRGARGQLVTEQDGTEYWMCRAWSERILALATDADNAALDKLLREARMAKKLKWDDFGEHGAKACAMLNSSYLIQLWRGRGEYELSVSVPGYGSAFDGPQFYPTLKDAKAAAQADYEARILAALEAPQ